MNKLPSDMVREEEELGRNASSAQASEKSAAESKARMLAQMAMLAPALQTVEPGPARKNPGKKADDNVVRNSLPQAADTFDKRPRYYEAPTFEPGGKAASASGGTKRGLGPEWRWSQELKANDAAADESAETRAKAAMALEAIRRMSFSGAAAVSPVGTSVDLALSEPLDRAMESYYGIQLPGSGTETVQRIGPTERGNKAGNEAGKSVPPKESVSIPKFKNTAAKGGK